MAELFTASSQEAQPTTRRRRVLRRRVIGLLGFVLLVHAAGGWYFSSQIRSDGLLVKEQAFDPNIVVASRDETSITFERNADSPDDLISDELLGVEHASGYGQVGVVLEATSATVTREYGHIAGTAPEPGTAIELEGFAYPPDPGAVGLDHTAISVQAPFGEFPAWLIDGPSNTWAIFVHGRGSHMREGLRIAPILADAGMPVMLISYRNDENSPETDARLGRFGAAEWEDLEAAVAYAADNGAHHIVLVGFSMGGAISMAFLEQSPLADMVTAVIFDSPALDLGDMIGARAGDTDLIPGLPLKVPGSLTAVARTFAAVRFGIDFSEVDYLSRPESLTVPALLIHGDDDGSVPVAQSIEMADHLGEQARLEVFPDAGHVRSWNVDRTRYEQVVAEFLLEVLGNRPKGA